MLYVHPICLQNRQTDSLTLSILPFQVCFGVLEHEAAGLGLRRRRFHQAAAPRATDLIRELVFTAE